MLMSTSTVHINTKMKTAKRQSTDWITVRKQTCNDVQLYRQNSHLHRLHTLQKENTQKTLQHSATTKRTPRSSTTGEKGNTKREHSTPLFFKSSSTQKENSKTALTQISPLPLAQLRPDFHWPRVQSVYISLLCLCLCCATWLYAKEVECESRKLDILDF